jgi:hypothetical protein
MSRVPSGVISRAPNGFAITPPPPNPSVTRATGITVRLPTTTGSPYTFLMLALAAIRSLKV